jgi:hypothetical protein
MTTPTPASPRYALEPRMLASRRPGWQVRDTRPPFPEADAVWRGDSEDYGRRWADALNKAEDTPLPWPVEAIEPAALAMIRAHLARHFMDPEWSRHPVKFGSAIANNFQGRKPCLTALGRCKAYESQGYPLDIRSGTWIENGPIDPVRPPEPR